MLNDTKDMTTFVHRELTLVTPTFEGELTDLIIELDHLRKKRLGGTTHPYVFFQLKKIFHTLESLGSARIEGNNTTISEFIEKKLDTQTTKDEKFKEISNIEKAIDFIESNSDNILIGRKYISELHQIIVEGLTPPPKGEGDKTPGKYRGYAVNIAGSSHKPPDTPQQIDSYMQELFNFLDDPTPPKYDLIKMAQAHHRFMWIHPFGNGNGRVGRLFTYALLVKAGFNVHVGSIINPTAVFCIDREEYNKKLSAADSGLDEDLLNWCAYVLGGLKSEIDKIDMLLDYNYLKKEILLPALNHARDRQIITGTEYKILVITVQNQVIKNSTLKPALKGMHTAAISRFIKNLRDKKMLVSEDGNSRKYHMNYNNNYLIRSVVGQLREKGFIPQKLDEKNNI